VFDPNMKVIFLNIAVFCLLLGCTVAVTVLSVPGACAQSKESASTSKTHIEKNSANEGDLDRTLSSKVNNPTALLPYIQFRDVLAPNVPGVDGSANLFQIQPVLPISPSHGIPFAQLIRITLSIVTAPVPDRTTGCGDFQFFDLVPIKQSWGTWGLGTVLVFPTATPDSLGQGKWQVGPAAAIMYTAVKHLQMGALFQNPISFAGDSGRESVNALFITPTLTYNLPGGWFGGYSDFDWIFDWENNGEATIPIGLQIGKVFTLGSVPFSFSLEGGYNVIRPSDTPRWLVGFELNWILTGHSKTH
jgi:hypothetical protein